MNQIIRNNSLTPVRNDWACVSIPTLRIDAPILVFGGSYSNLEATQAMLREARRLGIPSQRIVCTGDIVAYGADPVDTVELVRNAVSHVVMGNCEESLAAQAADCGCGFPLGSTCEQLSSAWFLHADRELNADARTWMGGLPRRIDILIGAMRFAVIHGGITKINQFTFASTPAEVKVNDLSLAGVDGIIGGHCGLPFTQIVNGKLWHNAGAIGMPANDGTPRVWFSLIMPRDDGISIEHRAIEYDHQAAARKIRKAALPEGYAESLETGLWPSCDVLPFDEIRERGTPLVEGCVTWHRSVALTGSHIAPRSDSCEQLWPGTDRDSAHESHATKFLDPFVTARGELRATVALKQLKTLWFNTGTLCNIACRNCYIESSPRNDRLVYLTHKEVTDYLDEIDRDGLGTEEIGFTGGEPFMNPQIFEMLEECLSRKFRVLVLTNAMRPMQRSKTKLLDLNHRLGDNLTIRVSLDHFTLARHEEERGTNTFKPSLDGLIWLVRNGFRVTVAGRTMWAEDLSAERAGYARLFSEHAIPLDAHNTADLVLFPEMDPRADVPEITTACWEVLGKSPADLMCASSRMIVKRKADDSPTVVSCTLLPYESQFELGKTLNESAKVVHLNHPHCAKFCVLGGASCSAKS